MFNKTLSFFFLLALLQPSLLTAQRQIDYLEERVLLEKAKFPENYEIRQLAKRAIEAASLEEVDTQSRQYQQNDSPNLVEISVRKDATTFLLIFANETGRPDVERFSAVSKGSYVFRKRIDTGEFEYLRIFLQSDGHSFIEIKPDGDNKSRMDIYIFGTPTHRNIKIPLSFLSLSTSPLARLMSITKTSVIWKELIPPPAWSDWQMIRSITSKINPYLALLRIRDTDDGAQNAKGEFVKIANGNIQNPDNPQRGGFNCSGFAKWVADGFFAPLNGGKLMDPNELKKESPERKTNSLNIRFVERDPYFGLDWVRNIAYTLTKQQYPNKRLKYDTLDVNDIPFLSYIPDVGYPLTNLEAILYYQAIRYPNSFYLGSVNKEFGTNPPLRQHLHTAVFFPYFDNNGEFVIDMYERNVKSTPDRIRRYTGGYIHLERVEVGAKFSLPEIQ